MLQVTGWPHPFPTSFPRLPLQFELIGDLGSDVLEGDGCSRDALETHAVE